MRVVILRSNLETVSPRGIKTAKALSSAGHKVNFLGWDREGKHSKVVCTDFYESYRFKLKAPYGFKIIFYLPVWWFFEFLWLMQTKWDVVHAIDFDAVVPAVIAAKIKRKPVIYEIADIFEMGMQLPAWLRNVCIAIDKLFMYFVDGMILVNEKVIEEFNGIPNKNIIVIYNSPPDFFEQRNSYCLRNNNIFTLFYASALHKSRQLILEKVFEAVKKISGTRIIIAGYIVEQTKKIKEWTEKERDKVKFLGQISYVEVLEETMASDLLFCFYDPAIPNNKLSTPNKLFEAMMCGKPILVSKGTLAAEIIEKENCGLAVDCNSIKEIKEAILKLKENPELCRQFGKNGRRAYERQYSWKSMEQRLLEFYQEISKIKPYYAKKKDKRKEKSINADMFFS